MMLLAAALALQDASADAYYKFKPGTAWTYARRGGDGERAIEAKVLEEKDGRVVLEWNEKTLDGALHQASELTWSVQDGLLWAEARPKGDGLALELPVLKLGSRKDDAWTTAQGTTTHHGQEEIEVPAGTYKDAVRTQLRIGDGPEATLVDFYLVPKVGLAKATVVSPTETLTIELKSFAAP